MRLTEARLSYLSRRFIDRLRKDGVADFPDEAAAFREAKRVLLAFLKVEEDVDALVRRKLGSLARSVPEGGREWDILYRKYFEEEMSRRNLG